MRLVLCLLLVACEAGTPMTDGGAPHCVPGASAPCACSDGKTGAQVCKSDGTFEVCVCTSSSTSNNSMVGGTTGGSTTGGSTTGGSTTGNTMQPSDCGHPK